MSIKNKILIALPFVACFLMFLYALETGNKEVAAYKNRIFLGHYREIMCE